MSNADWSIAVGVLVFIIAIIVAAIYYFRFKRIYLIAYVASIATYVFSVFYIWDVYELKKNGVLVLLLISTGLMIFLGKHFKGIHLKPDKVHTSLKEKESK